MSGKIVGNLVGNLTPESLAFPVAPRALTAR
jgi:hypothetical protein